MAQEVPITQDDRIVHEVPESYMCGAYGDEKEADERIQSLVDKVKPELEEKMGQSFEVFQAISYKSQLVSGWNYRIKVNIGNNKYINIKVYQNLQKEVSLSEYQFN